MKKIISMGIASAVLALTAIAASADIVAVTDKVVEGNTVKVTITTDAELSSFGFVVSATGLELVGDPADVGLASFKVMEDGSVRFAGGYPKGWKAGDTIATLTYTVTAKAGEKVAVALSDFGDMGNVLKGTGEIEVVAEGAGESSSSESSSESTSESSSESTSESTPESGESDPGTDPGANPGTGIALAVVPAVLAGAAVVVAKKRK